jgi:hypothetical protein
MKKLAFTLVIGVFLFFLMGCDVISVVTVNDSGEKVIHTFISLMGETVYDATVSVNNWREMAHFNEWNLSSEDLLFSIVSRQDNMVVLGTADYAIEVKFFDGGYKYMMFVSSDGLSNAFR